MEVETREVARWTPLVHTLRASPPPPPPPPPPASPPASFLHPPLRSPLQDTDSMSRVAPLEIKLQRRRDRGLGGGRTSRGSAGCCPSHLTCGSPQRPFAQRWARQAAGLLHEMASTLWHPDSRSPARAGCVCTEPGRLGERGGEARCLPLLRKIGLLPAWLLMAFTPSTLPSSGYQQQV